MCGDAEIDIVKISKRRLQKFWGHSIVFVNKARFFFIMTIPGKRLARRRKHLRASHTALKPLALSVCPKCKKPTLPHHACAFCGYYRGRSFTDSGSASKTPAAATATANAKPQSQKESPQAADSQKPTTNDVRDSKDTSSSARPSADAS